MTCPGGKGLLDLALFKWDIRKHLLNEVLASLGMDADTKDSIQRVVADHSVYRSKVGFPGESGGDRAWMGLLSPTAKKFFSILEECVFGVTFDSTLKLALKAGKSPAEALEDDSLHTEMTEMKHIAKDSAS